MTNVQAAFNLAGGIQRFIDQDDVVILKPNGQWPNQGYTLTQSMKALIDVILIRPGGFNGEIIIAEHVHSDHTTAMGGSYTGQKVKTIFLPNLNNHGSLNLEDYAGPTSPLKCHLGIQDFNVAGGTNSLHGVGYNDPISPQAMGESAND